MGAEALGDQRHADQHQECQREDLDRRVRVDELADRLGGEHHHADRGHDRDHHHRHVVGHAHRGDHRVEREHDVDDCDLHQDAGEADARCGRGARRGGCVVLALEAGVDLVHALPEQEQAAADEDEVAARDLLPEHAEQRLGQPHDPGQRQQQQDARAHRERQAEPARKVAPFGRQPADQDRDEDDVVDAEHDLECGQRGQGDPGVGIGDPVEHVFSCLSAGSLRWRTRPLQQGCQPGDVGLQALAQRLRRSGIGR